VTNTSGGIHLGFVLSRGLSMDNIHDIGMFNNLKREWTIFT
jgi:hypothetical protein